MLPDIKNSDGLEELLYFIFSNPQKTYKHKSNKHSQLSASNKDISKRLLRTAIILITMILVLSQLSYAQNQIEISTQSTANNNDFLFFLKRSPGTNKVGYALNYNTYGKLCDNKPIKAFWISENNHQKLKALTTKEERQGYGLKTKPIGNSEFEIRLIAYNKVPLYLKKSEIDKSYRIYIQDEDKALLLKRIFIKLNHGTFWFPKLQYIDLTTTTLNSETKL